MSNLLTLHTNLEQHYLQHEFANKAVLIEEPLGWKTSNKKLKRSSATNEMIEKNAKSIAFIGKGREYLKNTDAIYGSNCRIRYTVVKENPRDATDFYKDVYFVNLDTHIDKDGQFAVQIDEGGLAQIIKAKQNEKFEIDREIALNGNNIGTFKGKTLTIEGRKIFLKTLFEKEHEDLIRLTTRSNDKHTSRGCMIIPLELSKQNSHLDYAFSVNGNSYGSKEKEWQKPRGSDAFFNCDNLPAGKELKLKLHLKSTFRYAIDVLNGAGTHKLGVKVTVFNDKKIERDVFSEERANIHRNETGYFDIDEKINLKLEKGDYVCFYAYNFVDSNSYTERTRLYVNFLRFNSTLSIEEDSENKTTQTECIHVHDAIERQLEIITGKQKLFKSDFLGRKELGYTQNGEGSDTVLLPLLWARGFKKKPKTPKPSISLKDIVDSISAVWGLNAMVEKKGFKEILRLEPLNFFYNPNVTVRLPHIVKDIEVKYARTFLINSYVTGYEKGGDGYEEITGLGSGEYNGKMYFTSVRDNTERKLIRTSKVRADSTATEFARRKHFDDGYSQADTQYDKDWAFIDTKKDPFTDVLKERKWQDDFSTEPEGIYSPETATNLRLTPKQMLLRRKFFMAGQLVQYPSSYVRFTSSNCQTELVLNPKQGKEVKEVEDILVRDLGKARFKPYLWKFKHHVDYNLQKELREKTTIDGTEIYNFYGLIEFRVAENEYKYGYLMEVDENKGEITILEANI